MKKILSSLVLATLIIPAVAVANNSTTTVSKVQAAVGPTTTQLQTNNGQATVVSPRTGIQYTIPNENHRPVVIQTQAIAPANTANVDRIVASNPALSEESQQMAKKALLDLSK